jgi:hypothetical protein
VLVIDLGGRRWSVESAYEMGMQRFLLRWAWIAGSRELTRSQRVAAEDKVVLTVAAGIVVAPLVVFLFGGAYLWWLFTGKRIPGPVGRWIGAPSRLMMNAHPKQTTQMPPEMRAALGRLQDRHRRIREDAARDLGREPTAGELAGYLRRHAGQGHVPR